uniref:Pirin family protein n=1 Tax=Anaerolinea thermolimosa TaxID=229919 RepID=A0A7C4KIX9_9CHLR
MEKIRVIRAVIEPQMVIEGAGVRLLRSIAPRVSNEYDPFLLFDHFAFNDPNEGPIAGFPTHPHRGIETVTYMLEGNVRHRDSLGNVGIIGPGDVQWMTSGRGILHEEMPRRGPDGVIYGFQLWVNLPAALKMSRPRYQEVRADTIPVIEQEGVRVRVVAGTYAGNTGPVTEIAADPLYMDISLQPGAIFEHPVVNGHTTLVYLFQGEIRVGENAISAVKMLHFEDGDILRIEGGDLPARFMAFAGAPFKEPIVPYGPFVMNTVEEIQQTLIDLRNGTFVQG